MATTETRTHQNYIGGEWVAAADGRDLETMTRRRRAARPLPAFRPEDVDRAVAAAKKAFEELAAHPRAQARRDALPCRALLAERKEEIARS